MVTRRQNGKTNPNGNTIGRVVGETSQAQVLAAGANPQAMPETEEEKGFWASASDWLTQQKDNVTAAIDDPGAAVQGFAKDLGNTPTALLNLISVMGMAQVGSDMRTQAYGANTGSLSPQAQQAAFEAGTQLMTNPAQSALIFNEPFPLESAAEVGGALIGSLNPKGMVRGAAAGVTKSRARATAKAAGTTQNSASTSKNATLASNSSGGKNPANKTAPPTSSGGSGGNNSGKIKKVKRRASHRCELVPYDELICGANQQAHHVVPDWMLRLGKRNGKDRIHGMPTLADGPAICLESGKGKAHRKAHSHVDRTAERVARGGRSTGEPGTLRQGQALVISSRAIEKATGGKANGGCDRKDISDQLRKHFKAPDNSLLRGVYHAGKVTERIKNFIAGDKSVGK